MRRESKIVNERSKGWCYICKITDKLCDPCGLLLPAMVDTWSVSDIEFLWLYSLNGNTLEETEFTSTRGVSLNQEILNWPEFVVYLLMVLVLGTPAPRHRVVRTLTAHSLAA